VPQAAAEWAAGSPAVAAQAESPVAPAGATEAVVVVVVVVAAAAAANWVGGNRKSRETPNPRSS